MSIPLCFFTVSGVPGLEGIEFDTSFFPQIGQGMTLSETFFVIKNVRSDRRLGTVIEGEIAEKPVVVDSCSPRKADFSTLKGRDRINVRMLASARR